MTISNIPECTIKKKEENPVKARLYSRKKENKKKSESMVALEKCGIMFKHVQFNITTVLLPWGSIRIQYVDKTGLFFKSKMPDKH